ncbi:glycine cleavage system protein GcvH [Bifidobacterium magnum]|uniref:Glycine cleavage system H protein n=1 Tax=Bifidobacterium magnum TaxID=1692 RepID=A0A087BEZ7_9BIFI|nr:glycine cleavage system protein GcvH [Bifidobacterium magnum]KFI69597.1 Glycine cleavage H-protein [Bifidobacterium magnum]
MSATLDIDVPRHLLYSDDHVWVDEHVEPAMLGITQYAADQLGKLVFVDLPDVGTHVEVGDQLAQLESAKSIEPMISPVAGTVRYVNNAVDDDAEIINDDPYGEGWIVKIELDDDEPDLLDAEAYEKHIQ